MNGRSSTATGLAATDAGDKVDHLSRLRRAAAHILEAESVLAHKETHEVRLACIHLKEAHAEIRIVETQTVGQGQQGGEGVHVEAQEDAEKVT